MPFELNKGVFTLSLDLELIWGTLDLYGPEGFRKICERERSEVMDRLLDLFVEFNVSATWCVLGHLFLKSCKPIDGQKHSEIVRPNHAWHKRDWFIDDPCGTEEEFPIFYGSALVEKIRACPVPQEIGCHSFSHVIFGDQGCSREAVESEIRECVRLAKERGLELKSFAFPRNRVGHLDVLRQYGFKCFRGPEPHWYENGHWPHFVKRLGHLWDVLIAAQPPVVVPELTKIGLWNVPGSMLYFPMHGLRRFIPLSLRVKRAVKGLKAASEQKKIFHLWFHPTNLADQVDPMFSGLRQILEYAHFLHQQGTLDILPMDKVRLGFKSDELPSL